MVLSRKQRLATKDSTEAELVALSDYVAKVEWSQGYLEERGIKLDAPIVLNDNTSTITIINKRDDKPLRNRHLTARRSILKEFFCKDKFGILRYEPTKSMIVDVMTKLLMGEGYLVLASAIMGWSKFPENTA